MPLIPDRYLSQSEQTGVRLTPGGLDESLHQRVRGSRLAVELLLNEMLSVEDWTAREALLQPALPASREAINAQVERLSRCLRSNGTSLTADGVVELLEKTRKFTPDEDVDRAITLFNDFLALWSMWKAAQERGDHANIWIEPASLRSDVFELLDRLDAADTAADHWHSVQAEIHETFN